MDLITLILIAIILCLGNGVQATIGFGAGMVSIPLLLWLGLDLPQAIAILAASVFMQLTLKMWRYWKEIEWSPVLIMAVARLSGYIPGFIALYYLHHAGQTTVKQVVGAAILVAVVVQVALRVQPQAKVRHIWTGIAGFFSGLGASAVGMGGPPIVLWVMAHDWSAKKARLFLWASFWLLMPVGVLPLYFWFEARTLTLSMGLGFFGVFCFGLFFWACCGCGWGSGLFCGDE